MEIIPGFTLPICTLSPSLSIFSVRLSGSTFSVLGWRRNQRENGESDHVDYACCYVAYAQSYIASYVHKVSLGFHTGGGGGGGGCMGNLDPTP